MSTLIIPGDSIPLSNKDSNIVIGPGIHEQVKQKKLIATQAGIFNEQHKRLGDFIYVESNLKKYVPQTNDFVIGVVTGTFGEFYKVELSQFSSHAILSMMAFPNASRKNRPNLGKGDLVYARISLVDPNIDTELECFDATTGKDGGFGPLEGGFCVDVKLGYARWLLTNKENSLLEKLSSFCKFEIAIGLNGKIWIKCDDLKTTLCCSKVLVACQSLLPEEFESEIKKQFKVLGLTS